MTIPNVPIPLALLAELSGHPISTVRGWARPRKVRRKSGKVTVYPARFLTYRLKGLIMVSPEEAKKILTP